MWEHSDREVNNSLLELFIPFVLAFSFICLHIFVFSPGFLISALYRHYIIEWCSNAGDCCVCCCPSLPFPSPQMLLFLDFDSLASLVFWRRGVSYCLTFYFSYCLSIGLIWLFIFLFAQCIWILLSFYYEAMCFSFFLYVQVIVWSYELIQEHGGRGTSGLVSV